MTTLDVSEGGRPHAVLELKNLSGLGRINPRLQFHFEAHPQPYTKVVLDDATLRLEFRQELLGEGRLLAGDISYDRSPLTFEVPISQRLLRYVTDGLSSTENIVQLDAKLIGRARVWVDPNAPDTYRTARPVGWEAGQWWLFSLGGGVTAPLQCARGEWYQQVLAQTRTEQYRFLEVALPQNDAALSAEWTNAVDLLGAAERAYVSGDDPGVFQQLRGALDSLPGAKQQILAGINDAKKQADLDDLLKQACQFLHDGRHVAAEGDLAGTFPVDHLDAAFALDLMRVLLSHKAT